MGTIRDSFKKFLGFDVEDQDNKTIHNQSDYKTIERSKDYNQDEDIKKSSFNNDNQPIQDINIGDQRLGHVNEGIKMNDKRDRREPSNIFAKSTIKYEKPNTYGDACEIVEYLLEGYTVFVDVIELELSKARRIIDFIDGAIYAAGGDREIIKHKYFKFSPTYEENKED